jgi:uncharacterized protein (DUF302 family)
MDQQTRLKFSETVVTGKSFDDAVEAVLAEVPKAKFRVLYVHDVQATLREKGFEHDPYKIIEVCSAPNAKRALDADPLVGLMMPCKINVFVADGKTHLSYLKPSLLAAFFPEAGIESLGDDVEKVLQGVIDTVK